MRDEFDRMKRTFEGRLKTAKADLTREKQQRRVEINKLKRELDSLE